MERRPSVKRNTLTTASLAQEVLEELEREEQTRGTEGVHGWRDTLRLRLGAAQRFLLPHVMSKVFNTFILVIILLNFLLLVLELLDRYKRGDWCTTASALCPRIPLGTVSGASVNLVSARVFDLLNNAFLGIFTGELVVKYIALRSRFWDSAWNRFDFCVVTIDLVQVRRGALRVKVL